MNFKERSFKVSILVNTEPRRRRLSSEKFFELNSSLIARRGEGSLLKNSDIGRSPASLMEFFNRPHVNEVK